MLLNVDVAQLGSDQRKVNMLAIEYAKSRKRKIPSVVSHHMLRGLRQSDVKMSKSDPYSAIFIDDDRETIFKKINKAYCPPSIVDNPIYEYVKYIILPNIGYICIDGNKYTNIDDVMTFIINSPKMIKDAVAETLDKMIEPIRKHFNSTPELHELLERVKSYRVNH